MLDIVIKRDGLGPSIPEGPRADYLSMFPWRSVRWNRELELYEILNENGTRLSLLFDYEVSADFQELELTRVRHFFNRGSHDVWRAFKPFDYRYVADRRRDWFESRHLTLKERLRQITDHNDRLVKKQKDAIAYEQAAALGEIRRWMGPLADTWDIVDGRSNRRRAYDDERIPQVAVGISI